MRCIKVPCPIEGLKQILLEVEFSNPDNDNAILCTALVDTGSTATCFTEQIADAIGVSNRGYIRASGVGGEHIAMTYHAGLLIPNIGPLEGEMEIVQIAEQKTFEAILGMDILSQGTFNFENNIFTLCLK